MPVMESKYHLGQVLVRMEDGRNEQKVVITQVGDGENTLTQFCYLRRDNPTEITINPIGGSIDPTMILRETGETLFPEQILMGYRQGYREMRHVSFPSEFIEEMIHEQEIMWGNGK